MESKEQNNTLRTRTPLGTKDFNEHDMSIRNYIFDTAIECFKTRDAVQIDTPVMELMNTVENLYGEEFNKLVYTLDNNELILRYDLTVPFARYIAMNGLKNLRRYQIGKVYRRDSPQMSLGRYREFYQCDFDIAGEATPQMHDIEMIDTAISLLTKLLGNTFKIKINYKEIFQKLLQNCDVASDKLLSVARILDKLDKISWEKAMTELKDIVDAKTIDKLTMIKENYSTNTDYIEFLTKNDIMCDDIKPMFKFLSEMNYMDRVTFDPFLVRGMEYYTGIIYEATYNDKNIMQSTIAGGGRYDNMIKKFSGYNVPAIGFSLGVERIAEILKDRKTSKRIDVYVASVGNDMQYERIKLCCILRNRGLICAMSHLPKPTMRKQFDDVFTKNANFMVTIGDTEITNGTLTIKNITTKEEKTYIQTEGIDFLAKNFELLFINQR